MEKKWISKISLGHNFQNQETELIALVSSGTIWHVAKISYQLVWILLGGGTKFYTHTHTHRGPFYKSCFLRKCKNKTKTTERGGSVVTHETRIREVPGSNLGGGQPGWGFFVVFLNHQGKCWVGFSLPRSISPLFIKFIYHKIKIREL